MIEVNLKNLHIDYLSNRVAILKLCLKRHHKNTKLPMSAQHSVMLDELIDWTEKEIEKTKVEIKERLFNDRN
jgi:hypothetical protein